jgi:hypothetical protein
VSRTLRSRTRIFLLVALPMLLGLLALVLMVRTAQATPQQDDRFKSAVASLNAGKPEEAILALEALRDDGIDDASVSFDLGLGYLSRAHIAEAPGDLGRAVFAFEEAKMLTRSDVLHAECTRIAGEVRSVIAKRRARLGQPTDMEEAPPPSRAFSAILPEDTWAEIALACAALLFLGLALRDRVGGRGKVAASIIAAGSFVLMLTAGAATSQRKTDRLSLEEAIVVADEVRPTDDKHIVLADAPALVAGTRVRVLDRRAGYVEVRTHGQTAWIPDRTLLPLPRTN